MQTSRMLARNIVKVLLVAIVFVVVDGLITFARAPYGSKSQVAWTDYSLQAENDIDTIIVGSSTVMAGVDPFIVDEELGASAYNLATPDQWLEESYIAIRTACEDHAISRVILGLTHAQLLRDGTPNPSSAFMYRRSQVVSLRQHLDGIGYLLFDGGAITERESIAMLFPWVSNHVDNSVSATMRNLRMKIDGTTLYDAATISESGWTYHGKGFGTYNGLLNYNTKSSSYFSQDKRGDVGKTAETSATINNDRARALSQICDYCASHGIELIAVCIPMPAYNVIEYGENYFVLETELKRLLSEKGARFFDLNLARPELLRLDESLFRDTEHVNIDGAEACTRALCHLIASSDAGEDTDHFFFDRDEYFSSIDTISCVFVDHEVQPDGVHIEAQAMTGSQVEVEYQFLEGHGEGLRVVRDWSRDATFVFFPEGGERGAYELHANARLVGSDAEYDRYRTFTVMY